MLVETKGEKYGAGSDFVVKRTLFVMLLSIMLLIFTSCDSGLAVTNVEIGSFPDNIVYFVGEADSVDLSGTTVISTVREGWTVERSIEDYMAWEGTGYVSDVNFLVPGVYEIQLYSPMFGVFGRIPIQVIEREYIECAICAYEISVVEE